MERYTYTHQPVTHFGVDFGAGFLVICSNGGRIGGLQTLEFPGWSSRLAETGASTRVYGIKTLIHFDGDGRRMIGDEVVRAGRLRHPATAQWIRDYLLEESRAQIPAGLEHIISFSDAAAVYLQTVLARAVQEDPGTPSVVFSIPPHAPSWYADWLGDVARSAGVTSWCIIDEHAAALTGYGVTVNRGREVIIIRFDEPELSVSVVRGNDSSDDSPPGGVVITGYARDDTGCRALDNWIAMDILARHRMACTGGKGQRMQEIIVSRIDEVFNQLTESGKAAIDISDPISGTTISARISCDDIGRIIEEHGFLTILERCLNRAGAATCGDGCQDTVLDAVLLIGRGSSLAPVQDMVRSRLSPVPVLCNHPFEAVARGAALFVPRSSAPENRIRNDYALRYWDPEAREHRYRFLVRNGARYPSAGQVARITISAAYDGQTRLGIPLYEIRGTAAGKEPSIELVSDPAGGVRCAGPAGSAGTGSRPLPVNGRTPFLLVADPPAVKGEPRFELTFLLDRDKQLCLSARDLVTGTLIKRDEPVHRLT